MPETSRSGSVPRSGYTGGNTHKMSPVPRDNPRTPKNAANGRSGANTAQRRAQDGTRANATGKKESVGPNAKRL